MKTAIVASTNPVKIDAVRRGLAHLFPAQTFAVQGIGVESGVSDQPMSDGETLQGALNRAYNAKIAAPDADYWFGIEGGLEAAGQVLQGFAWVVALDGQFAGRSRTATFILPDEVAQLVRQGHELGHADDIVFDRHNSKQDTGSVGILTGNAVTRTTYYEQAVMLALIPFKNPHLAFRG